MKRLAKVNTKESPKLFDILGNEIVQQLAAKLPWLTHVFGNTQRIRLGKGQDTKYRIPAFHFDDREYLDLTPCEKLGNYCFLYLHDPQDLEINRGSLGDLNGDCSVVFWFDLDRIPEATNRNIEHVKASVLKAVVGVILPYGRLTPYELFEDVDGVFSGFSIDETGNRYLMHPFAGLRIRCRYTIPLDNCL